jgi:hypothetical protein
MVRGFLALVAAKVKSLPHPSEITLYVCRFLSIAFAFTPSCERGWIKNLTFGPCLCRNKFPTRDFRAASVLFDVARRRYSTEAVQKVEVKTEITPEPAKTETEATKTTDKWANVQRLIELCRPEAKPLAVAMVALGFSSAATLILPAAMGRVRFPHLTVLRKFWCLTLNVVVDH